MGADPESSTDEWEAPYQRSGDVSGRDATNFHYVYFECRMCEDMTGIYLAFLSGK